MTVPDFLIIGAMKCGTTTLQEQLASQPGIFMTTPKEPNYFSDDIIFSKGSDWYSGLFERASSGDLKGEASTHYTKQPTYPDTLRRLQTAVSAPKLIYMIRNPMDRVISHYLHGWSQAEISMPFDQALSELPELVEYGRFGMQIAPFLETFGAEAIHLTSLEQFKTDPQKVLNEIGDFLGVKTPLTIQANLGAQNVSAKRYRKFPFSRLLVENNVASALRRRLIPKSLRQKIRDARTRKDRPEFSDAQRSYFEKVFIQDRTTLSASFPDHPAISLCYPFAHDCG